MNKNMRSTRFVLSCKWVVYFSGSVREDEASSTSEDIWLYLEMLYRLAANELHVATELIIRKVCYTCKKVRN